jgi:hypothetical protein
LVYDELRKLAAAKLAQEKPGQTLQTTAPVQETYLRLVGGEPDAHGNSFSAVLARIHEKKCVSSPAQFRGIKDIKLDAVSV